MMDALIDAIDHALVQKPQVLLAIAGPPAAGKSTLSNTLLQRYGDAVIVPMDGFHLDNNILDAKGLRHRKGAPETFDVGGFMNMVDRIASGVPVFAPAFDREADLARAGAIAVEGQKLIIFEGNYLLFDEAPWRELAKVWSLSVRLQMSLQEVERRSVQRWLDHGFSEGEAINRARTNDVKNAARVLSASLEADMTVRAHATD